jgi:hypothetical protein
MKYYSILLSFLVLGCSTAKQDSIEAIVTNGDSSITVHPVTENLSYEPVLHKEDSNMFIGVVEYHEKTNELFIPVYYRADSVDATFFEDMQLELDSIIVNDDELTRKRLKMEVARKYFNLVGLDKIAVFNRYGGRLGAAEFVRVEYLDEMIEASYTAVFKPEMKISAAKNEASYCTSQGKTTFTEHLWNWHVLADPEVDRHLLKTFKPMLVFPLYKHCPPRPCWCSSPTRLHTAKF